MLKKSMLPTLLLIPYFLVGQFMYPPSDHEISMAPDWAKELYSNHADFFKVEQLYNSYYKNNEFVKTYHTQYYKRWKKLHQAYLKQDGTHKLPELSQRINQIQDHKQKLSNSSQRDNSWQLLGPVQVFNSSGQPGHDQTNVYSIDRSEANPDVLYCGTEPGEVYRSDDFGQSWRNISLRQQFGGGVNAIESSPENVDLVFAGSGMGVFRSENGGTTWELTLGLNYRNVSEILVHPEFSQRVFACTDAGLFTSEDQGKSWIQVFTEKVYDIKVHPENPQILYLVKNNLVNHTCEFFRSTDSGTTWTKQTEGWFNSTDEARYDGGARLAITKANPSVVYAYLIGEAKAGDLGFIGVYKSSDSGVSWTCVTGETGGPYSDEHPNLAIGWPGWDYHQGFYNCAIMVSNTDENHILVGGLNLWKSLDGGNTWAPHAGYRGGPLSMHVDVQDMRSSGNEYWVTTDGGIYFSTDFFTEQPDFTMKGIHGSDYWGFGSGWNEDVLVGGLYHNGNLASYEKYNFGEFLSLGGGEAPTGYVNPGNNRKTYFSDIGGKIIPINIFDPVSSFSFGKAPNESYWSASSSEMEFHPACYNIAILGNENKLWKTTDGGSNFMTLASFGDQPGDRIQYIEWSRSNHDVIYCNQQMENGANGILWKTADGGNSWTMVNLPAGYSHRMLLSLDPLDENTLWLALPSGDNPEKIFKTLDGGQNWINLTSEMLYHQEVHSILHIGGTDGGIYYCTNNTVYYRNNEMDDWRIAANGLPDFFNANIARPFYRDNKVRIASYGKGIWEAPLEENPQFVIPQIMADKLQAQYICEIDSFYFDDYSVVAHEGTTWKWHFENGSPAHAEKRNPAVLFEDEGIHSVFLEITDKNGIAYYDTLSVEVTYFKSDKPLNEGFEGGFFPEGWHHVAQENGGAWSIAETGAFGESDFSAIFDNFNYDALGESSDLRIKTSVEAGNASMLTLDIAYAEYGYPYSDTLEILISTDCGDTFTSLYYKGGQDLATHPNSDQHFIPGETDWRTDSLFLPEFAEKTDIILALRNHGHWGNNIYVDNISIDGNSVGINTINENNFNFYPNPVRAGESIHFVNQNEPLVLTLLDPTGQKIMTSKIEGSAGSFCIPGNLIPGKYLINLRSETRIANRVLIVY